MERSDLAKSSSTMRGPLYLLDLDGACRGDAAQDLGSALSHLSWQAIRQPGRSVEFGLIDEALLAGYRFTRPRCESGVLGLVANCWPCADRCATLPPTGGC